MKNKIRTYTIALLSAVCCQSCQIVEQKVNATHEIDYCRSQASRTLSMVKQADGMPNAIEKDSTHWRFSPPEGWTSGFWPGILWYLYESTQDEAWKLAADSVTQTILPLTNKKARSHDSGFIVMCSLGNAYRLTGNWEYKDAILQAADSLAGLYNPGVGTILSWPSMVTKMDWPHNTIIDNMMNLELLFWASKNGGGKRLADIAVKHAEVTMKHQFRKDFSSYHVAIYDTLTGTFIKGVTHQGVGNHSMWARGQAWAIYGYTMTYRETQDPRFLAFARQVADVYLLRVPEDLIPYWDFDDPHVPDAFRDASAAAITASALLELSTYVNDKQLAATYRKKAEQMLVRLSSERYQSRQKNSAFLLHSVGHMPKQSEVDASIIYADYYYLEALIRLKRLQSGKKCLETL